MRTTRSGSAARLYSKAGQPKKLHLMIVPNHPVAVDAAAVAKVAVRAAVIAVAATGATPVVNTAVVDTTNNLS